MASMLPIKVRRVTTERLHQLAPMLRTTLASTSLRSIFQYAPTLGKYLLILLFLVNIRSWPLAWHIRVFRPVFRIRLQYRLLRLRVMFKSREVQDLEEDKWLDSIAPVGAHPFNTAVSYWTSAGLDDSDFNGHLSNSSYGKTLDAARFKAALVMFPQFFRAGGWMALAANHYHFIREIPMLSKYEVRVSIGAWDQKWLYVICRFVTKPISKSKSKRISDKPAEPTQTPPPASDAPFTATLRTPAADEISATTTATGTPLPRSDTDYTPNSNAAAAEVTTRALKEVAAGLLPSEEPDGAVLHTIAVSQMCFKIGRITVPPAVVLGFNGFSVPPPVEAVAVGGGYSHANPPPSWKRAKAVMSKPVGGSTKRLHGMMKGGWREVGEGERWWDAALGGEVEERRRANLRVLEALRQGLDGARAL